MFFYRALFRLFQINRYKGIFSGPAPVIERERTRIWLHASSVGELESLWRIAEMWPLVHEDEPVDWILTVFSASAISKVQDLSAALLSQGKKVLYAGYCPWEGFWGKALAMYRPAMFITAKYEAWPELWVSLTDAGIPLSIVGAKRRSSIRLAKMFCALNFRKTPRTLMVCFSEEDQRLLAEDFPDAQGLLSDDPRWDRVFIRSEKGSTRVNRFADQGILTEEKECGVFGSIWEEDLGYFLALYGHTQKKNIQFWLVPHKTSGPDFEKILNRLEREKISYVRTSENSAASIRSGVIVVDEMGYLSELYRVADWAYVGGGFTSGVHSTIEPAIHGMPIACGPKNAHLFTEIEILLKMGQLSLVRSPGMMVDWYDQSISSIPSSQTDHHDSWVKSHTGRRGAVSQIIDCMNEFAMIR